jgi:RHS repeat-associated protein
VYNGAVLGWYRHADWLGSSRVASTPSRTVYYDGAYAPFGEDPGHAGTSDPNFTGQNQDLTSVLYDFPAREYHPGEGRWISPDPAGLAAADPTQPQSWNRYAYVLNDPTSNVDPSGLWWVDETGQLRPNTGDTLPDGTRFVGPDQGPDINQYSNVDGGKMPSLGTVSNSSYNQLQNGVAVQNSINLQSSQLSGQQTGGGAGGTSTGSTTNGQPSVAAKVLNFIVWGFDTPTCKQLDTTGDLLVAGGAVLAIFGGAANLATLGTAAPVGGTTMLLGGIVGGEGALATTAAKHQMLCTGAKP